MKEKKKFKICDRCKREIESRVFYRYPHCWKSPSDMGSCSNAIFSKMLVFCPKCVEIFDKLDIKMRAEFMFVDNETLIKFYSQYGDKK